MRPVSARDQQDAAVVVGRAEDAALEDESSRHLNCGGWRGASAAGGNITH